MPPSRLPEGAISHGVREVVVQDIRLEVCNRKFILERWFVPSTGQVIEAELPLGFQGSEFGPALRAFLFMLYFQGRVTQKKIERICAGIGTQISDSEICRILNRPMPGFEDEHEGAKQASFEKCGFLQIDDTGARIFDRPAHTVVACNPYMTSYFTTDSKSRLSVIEALSFPHALSFVIHRTSLRILKGRVGRKHLKQLSRMKSSKLLDESELQAKMKRIEHLPKPSHEEILSACAIAGYRANEGYRPTALVSDDGTNFKRILDCHQLCWIHEIRHYREMYAAGPYYENILKTHLKRMREFYRRLKLYKKNPTPEEKQSIEAEFDRLFRDPTDFRALNEQLPLTWKRKKGLLAVLDHPHLPLHNNESETDLRERVLKRRISYGNRSHAGVRAWDLHLGIAHTCRKLNVGYWDYLKDRFEKKGKIPPLHRLIREAA